MRFWGNRPRHLDAEEPTRKKSRGFELCAKIHITKTASKVEEKIRDATTGKVVVVRVATADEEELPALLRAAPFAPLTGTFTDANGSGHPKGSASDDVTGAVGEGAGAASLNVKLKKEIDRFGG